MYKNGLNTIPLLCLKVKTSQHKLKYHWISLQFSILEFRYIDFWRKKLYMTVKRASRKRNYRAYKVLRNGSGYTPILLRTLKK